MVHFIVLNSILPSHWFYFTEPFGSTSALMGMLIDSAFMNWLFLTHQHFHNNSTYLEPKNTE